MTIVANTYAYVIGVDTHARTHTFVVLDTGTGAKQATATFPTTPVGLSRAVAWVARRTGGLADVLVVIEGIGSYGATVARRCTTASYRVVEPFPTSRHERRGRGKSDELDAELIARSVLAADSDQLCEPRHDAGVRAALRVLVAARDQINAERTKAINALTALLRSRCRRAHAAQQDADLSDRCLAIPERGHRNGHSPSGSGPTRTPGHGMRCRARDQSRRADRARERQRWRASAR
jgi:transposase